MRLGTPRSEKDVHRWAQDTAERLNSFFKDLTSVDELRLRPGSIVYWSGSRIPNGWVECDGRKLSKKAYSQLHREIGGDDADPDLFSLPNVTNVGSARAIIKI